MTLGVVTAIGTVASAGMSYVTQQNAIKKQESANNQWAQWQTQQRQAENVRQEQLRQKAEAARQGTLAEVAPEAQADAQKTEQGRLSKELGGEAPIDAAAAQAAVNNELLSGQSQGGTEFQTDIAKRINTATQDARKRIQALATIQSYGGSFGGLGTRNALAFNEGNQNLKMLNNQRQGSLGAYGAAQGVDPVKYATVSNPYGGIASSLAGIAGNQFGTYLKTPTTKA
jgi:hypothetical protein